MFLPCFVATPRNSLFIEVVAIHGGLDQEERHEAIRSFKEGSKDVLIGTDVASKGLDFPAIQHVPWLCDKEVH